jgi:3-phenylpropionate/cinnamic acid dioxygenase small subunit
MEVTPSLPVGDHIKIEELLFRFMRAFDEKDWDAMSGCLTEMIRCDYSSFRGTAASDIARGDYVDQRRTVLTSLRTQHNLSNLSISGSANHAEVKCHYVIPRFGPAFDSSPDQYFHSYGQYRFTVVRIGGAWKIASITQLLLTNEGNPALHGGLRK